MLNRGGANLPPRSATREVVMKQQPPGPGRGWPKANANQSTAEQDAEFLREVDALCGRLGGRMRDLQHADQQDILQMARTALLRQHRKGGSPAPLAACVAGQLTHCKIDKLRRLDPREKLMDFATLPESFHPTASPTNHEIEDRRDAVLASVSERDLLMLRLRYDHLSYAAIGEIVGMTGEGVRKHLAGLLDHLSRRLSG